MILFGHYDKKFLCIQRELKFHEIDSEAVKAKHPILTPFYILKLMLQGKRIEVFVFRYINDSSSLPLAILRVVSDLLTILVIKTFGGSVWWICHNVDKETSTHYPKITEFRRKNIAKFSNIIFTTHQLLLSKAKEIFPRNVIDFLSLGYIENGALNIKRDIESEHIIEEWIKERRADNVKFIFCIGSPAKKSIHFQLIKNFMHKINESSEFDWYAIVVGAEVDASEYIYNIPYKQAFEKKWLKTYSDFYYRAIDDYSMSYSVYEAAHLEIPIICENYGILPAIIEEYKLGFVVNDNDLAMKVRTYRPNNAGFSRFLEENNWETAANKISNYYMEIRRTKIK